jgi:hypothetical protein
MPVWAREIVSAAYGKLNLRGRNCVWRQADQDQARDAFRSCIEIGLIQPLQARHRHDLGREIGVMLGSSPDQENQMCRVDCSDPSLRNPSLDNAHKILNLGPNTGLQGRHENWCALQDFTRKDARRLGIFACKFNFLRDIAAKFLVRIAALIQAINQVKPDIECMAQNGLIQCRFSFKVIVQIGLRHVRQLSHFFDGRAMKAIGRKNLLRGTKNFSFITDLNSRAFLLRHFRDLTHITQAGQSTHQSTHQSMCQNTHPSSL